MCLYLKIGAAGSLKCCHLSNRLLDMISRKTTVLIYTTVRMQISQNPYSNGCSFQPVYRFFNSGLFSANLNADVFHSEMLYLLIYCVYDVENGKMIHKRNQYMSKLPLILYSVAMKAIMIFLFNEAIFCKVYCVEVLSVYSLVTQYVLSKP